MFTRLKQLLLSNAVMVVCSFIIGYSLWYMLSSNRVKQQSIQTTIIVRDTTGTPIKQVPLTMVVEGAMHALQHFTQHIPVVALTQSAPEQHIITIKHSDLLVPQTITVLRYAPHEIAL